MHKDVKFEEQVFLDKLKAAGVKDPTLSQKQKYSFKRCTHCKNWYEGPKFVVEDFWSPLCSEECAERYMEAVEKAKDRVDTGSLSL